MGVKCRTLLYSSARSRALEQHFQIKETIMKCSICKTGETHTGKATVTLQRGEGVLVIRGVPAEIREDCGEYYLDEVTARRVYSDAEQSDARPVEVKIQRYAA